MVSFTSFLPSPVEDIFSKTLVSYMYGENIKVSVKVFEVKTIDNKEVYTQLELKDFYTDYNYIPRYSWPSNSDAISSDNKNVLSLDIYNSVCIPKKDYTNFFNEMIKNYISHLETLLYKKSLL